MVGGAEAGRIPSMDEGSTKGAWGRGPWGGTGGWGEREGGTPLMFFGGNRGTG